MTLVKRKDNWFPSIFDGLLNEDWMDETNRQSGQLGLNVPAVNIQENEGSFLVEVAAPGMTKEDFNIELDNQLMSISSEKSKTQTESGAEEGKFTRKEFSYSQFRRSFSIPESVDKAKISANYENGVLLIKLPKKEEAKLQNKRLIEIS